MAMCMRRSRAASDAHAMYGVIWQFLAVSRELPFVGGYSSKTSMPAASSFPSLRASARACSSMCCLNIYHVITSGEHADVA